MLEFLHKHLWSRSELSPLRRAAVGRNMSVIKSTLNYLWSTCLKYTMPSDLSSTGMSYRSFVMQSVRPWIRYTSSVACRGVCYRFCKKLSSGPLKVRDVSPEGVLVHSPTSERPTSIAGLGPGAEQWERPPSLTVIFGSALGPPTRWPCFPWAVFRLEQRGYFYICLVKVQSEQQKECKH